jgi:hypothetical protein
MNINPWTDSHLKGNDGGPLHDEHYRRGPFPSPPVASRVLERREWRAGWHKLWQLVIQPVPVSMVFIDDLIVVGPTSLHLYDRFTMGKVISRMLYDIVRPLTYVSQRGSLQNWRGASCLLVLSGDMYPPNIDIMKLGIREGEGEGGCQGSPWSKHSR